MLPDLAKLDNKNITYDERMEAQKFSPTKGQIQHSQEEAYEDHTSYNRRGTYPEPHAHEKESYRHQKSYDEDLKLKKTQSESEARARVSSKPSDDYSNKHMNRREAPEYVHDQGNAVKKARSSNEQVSSNRNGQPQYKMPVNDNRNMYNMDDPSDYNKHKGSGGNNRGTPLSQVKLKNENVMTAILSLIKDLGEVELELIKREVEGRLNGLYEGDLKDIDDYY